MLKFGKLVSYIYSSNKNKVIIRGIIKFLRRIKYKAKKQKKDMINLENLLQSLLDHKRGKIPESTIQEILTFCKSRIFETSSHVNFEWVTILWLVAHYISATAASHGATLLILDNKLESLENTFVTLNFLNEVLPTSIQFELSQYAAETIKPIKYYHAQISDFEQHENKIFQRSGTLEDSHGAIFLRNYDFSIMQDIKFFEFTTKQPLLNYIVFVGKAPEEIFSTDLWAKNWKITKILKTPENNQVIIFTRKYWNEVLNNAHTHRRQIVRQDLDSLTSDTKELVPISDFSNIEEIAVSPVYPNPFFRFKIFSLDGQGKIHIKVQKTPPSPKGQLKLVSCQNIFLSGVGHIFSNSQVIRDSGLRNSFPKYNTTPKILEGSYLFIKTQSLSYSHMMCENVSNLHFLRYLPPNTKFLVFDNLTKSHMEHLYTFGIPEENCIFIKPDELFLIEKLYFFSSTFAYNKESVRFIRDHFLKNTMNFIENKKYKRIYISRQDSKSYRNLTNELDCIKIFKESGFTILNLSEFTLKEKINIFQNAEYVAGSIGAAFHYMLFSKSAKAIIISNENHLVPELFSLFDAMKTPVSYIRSLGFENYDDLSGTNSSFFLNTRLLQKAITQILN